MLCSMQTQAQTFLGNLQKQTAGEGKVTVRQSAEIDKLVNTVNLKASSTPQAPQTAATPTGKAPQSADTPQAKPHVKETEHPAHQTEQKTHPTEQKTHPTEQKAHPTEQKAPKTAPQTKADDTEATAQQPAVNTGKKVMRNSYKVTGYRIQVFSGGNSRADREKANRIGDAIKVKYPDEPVYVHFYSPRWICRVGNYRSYDEARKMLANIKAMGYPQACIVKGKITVAY